jgi:hypothetical protein
MIYGAERLVNWPDPAARHRIAALRLWSGSPCRLIRTGRDGGSETAEKQRSDGNRRFYRCCQKIEPKPENTKPVAGDNRDGSSYFSIIRSRWAFPPRNAEGRELSLGPFLPCKG